MKNLTCILLFLLFSVNIFAQGEANNWYFGDFAGMRFSADGTVTALPNSQIDTTEGCSSISDAQGNMLFYTDGRNVWDRNHVLMPNANYAMGTGLMGDPSSTQSAIIVPKKGDPNIYYIFTVDEPHHENAAVYPAQFTGEYPGPNGANGGTVPQDDDGFNNGLNYSIVDLSVTGSNGSIGDVVTRNSHLLTYNSSDAEQPKYKCSEKITAVKNRAGTGYWVITHFIDKFYAFSVNNLGVNETPVVTTILPIVPMEGYRRNSIGYLKASPDGKKLAVAHQQMGIVPGGTDNNGAVYLYDFNDATGVVTNAVAVASNVLPYGIEFSAQTKKLYVSYDSNGLGINGVHQYNLLSTDIAGSDLLVASTSQSGALQLGPNGKIYRAVAGSTSLDVINAPEEDGAACNYEPNGQNISGGGAGRSSLGLPPFITSVFSANIVANNSCAGQVTQFQLNVNGNFDGIRWNFGDGNSLPQSTVTNPTHTYRNPGIYTVTATVTRAGEAPSIIMNDITVSAIPVINAAQNLTECDPDNNGVTTFNLSANTPNILGTQSSGQFEVTYFASQANADANNQALNSTAYTNTAVTETIFARIHNKANTDCYKTTSFLITVSNTPSLTANSFAICDDTTDGDDANGKTTFNLTDITLLLVQNSSQFTTTYYASRANAQSVTSPLPQQFYNTTANSQEIYARIVNNNSPVCMAILPITLIVNPLPAATNNALLVQCDTGTVPDGLTTFNLTQADGLLTGGDANLAVAYYPDETAAQNNGTALSSTYTNTANPQIIAAKVYNVQTGCFRIMPLTLQANTNNAPALMLEHCDDDGMEDGLTQFTLTDLGLEAGGDVTYFTSETDALLEQNAISTTFTNTIPNRQIIYARVENNNDCSSIQQIELLVRALPDIDIDGEGIVCNNLRNSIMLDAGINASSSGYTYAWSTGALTPTIIVNTPGTYTVTVTNRYNCSKMRTIVVSPSDVAIINSIDIKDLTDNNTVTVYVTPTGNVNTVYFYSIDMPDGPFQESNYFENVTAGIHTVYVYDTNGCGIVHEDISVLEIPKYFTPNGDGVNETWNIIGVNALFYSNSTIYIFDRYGKLLANIDPKGLGWNGMYNNHKLPATDYWYVVALDNGRTVKGHFSLIR